MRYEVTVEETAARPTVVVPAATSWAEFPALWPRLLDEVWAGIAAAGLSRRCRNVMLYLDDVPNVEIGVELLEPATFGGRVVESALPAGRVATTVHRGPYAGLGAAHDAVHAWCAERGQALAGPRWEIYGHHREDPAELETEVCYLLA
jgi:effector-binding domain-containing protein